MVLRKDLESFLNQFLENSKISDVSLNGLQVEGNEKIEKIAVGVSANLALFEKAEALRTQAIIVHHGLFWERMNFRLTGVLAKRVHYLVKNNLNLFAYHLPLDLNEELGNNSSLLRKLPVKELKPFGNYHGTYIGYQADLQNPMSYEEIVTMLSQEVENKPVANYSFGPKKIKKVAAISGGAPSNIHEAIDLGLDLYITGEVTEYVQELCREAGINYLALGHYASEKFGVQNLAKKIQEHFEVETFFIDVANEQ